MTTANKASLRTLERRLAAVIAELETEQPALVQEMRLLQSLIELKRQVPTKTYAHVKTPRKAVQLVLTEHGPWLTKGEIADHLTEGGFISSNAERWVMNDTLNYQIEKGHLIRHGKGEKWDILVALPGTPPPVKS